MSRCFIIWSYPPSIRSLTIESTANPRRKLQELPATSQPEAREIGSKSRNHLLPHYLQSRANGSLPEKNRKGKRGLASRPVRVHPYRSVGAHSFSGPLLPWLPS